MFELKKKKKVNWNFSKLDYKLMGKYLEEMAIKGWMLLKIDRKKAFFIPCERRKLKFCVDITAHAETLSHKGNQELLEEYRNSCEELGWHFIASYDQMQFFYVEEYENPRPIQTDLESEQKSVIENVWKKEMFKNLYLIAFLTIYLVLVFHYVQKLNYRIFVAKGMFFCFYVFVPMVFIYVIISIVSNLSWYVKAKSHIKKGIEIKQKSFKLFKFKNYLINIFSCFTILILIFMYSDLLFPKGIFYYWTMLVPLITIVVVLVGSCIFYNRYSDKMKKAGKYSLVCSVFLVITVLLYIIVDLSLNENVSDQKNIVTVPEEYSIIKISDFSDIDEIDENYFRLRKSFLVPVSYEYDESYENDDKGVYICYCTTTEYYKCINVFFSNKIYESILDAYYYRKISNVSAQYWNCDKASLISDNTLLLLKGKEVIRIDIPVRVISIYDNEFREKVLDKFTK